MVIAIASPLTSNTMGTDIHSQDPDIIPLLRDTAMSIAKDTILSSTIISSNMGTATDKAMGMDTNTAMEVDTGIRTKLFVMSDL